MAEDQEEPTLPPHPPSATYGQGLPMNKRKRSVASQQLFSDSSDQPLFSSDDDPAAENYQDGRHRCKRQYTSLFDRQHPVPDTPEESSAARARRKFERHVDSGVFMGSDASFDSNLDIPVPPPAASRLPLPVPQYIQVPRSSQKDDRTPAEKEAVRKIERCIAGDTDMIDLSNMSLETLSNATVARLSEIGQDPTSQYDMPWDRAPSNFNLKLFLFNNTLTRIPKAVFNLQHLTVLSLRANRLTEIPPVIYKMQNLIELNFSQNLLRHLPMELLELLHDPLCRLTSLRLFPNPFCQPLNSDGTPYEWHSGSNGYNIGSRWLSRSTDIEGIEAKYWQRTPVQFMDTRHRLHGGPIYSSFQMDEGLHLPIGDSSLEPTFPTSKSTGRVLESTKSFSLVELMLQKLLHHPTPGPLDAWREAQLVPELVEKLEDMEKQRETGELRCTVCLRNFVLAKAQWIEWWELFYNRVPRVGTGPHVPAGREPLTSTPAEKLVPFLRKACSWKCVKNTFRGLGEPSSIFVPDGVDDAEVAAI